MSVWGRNCQLSNLSFYWKLCYLIRLHGERNVGIVQGFHYWSHVRNTRLMCTLSKEHTNEWNTLQVNPFDNSPFTLFITIYHQIRNCWFLITNRFCYFPHYLLSMSTLKTTHTAANTLTLYSHLTNLTVILFSEQ